MGKVKSGIHFFDTCLIFPPLFSFNIIEKRKKGAISPLSQRKSIYLQTDLEYRIDMKKEKNSKESDDKAMKAFKNIARSYYEDFDTRDYPKGKFDETCMDAVPLSFYLLSQASSFEDAIRLAISHGGDSDTIGAIVGSIAEARFGIPQEIKNRAMEYLPDEMQDVLKQFAGKCEIKPK